MNKKLLIMSALICGALTFTPQINYLPQSIAYAAVQTYTGVGDYVLSDDVPPGDVKSKAKLYAERNAIEQAGVFLTSYSKSQNFKLVSDEIVAIAGNILKVTDVQYEIIPLNDKAGIAKYRVTITAEIATDNLNEAINSWLNRDTEERTKLIEQNKSLQHTIDELQKRIAQLEQNAVNSKTAEDKSKLNDELNSINKYTLAAQKLESANKLSNQGKYSEAVKLYNESIQLNPNEYNVYYLNGIAYEHLHDYKNSFVNYDKSIKLKDNFSGSHTGRGNAYMHFKNYNAALEDYNRAVQIDPQIPGHYYNRALAYNALKDYKNALIDCDKAIKINSKNADHYYIRANTYTNLKDYKHAVADYTNAIKYNPKHELAYNMRGAAYRDLKNYKNSLKDYAKAIELNPNNAGHYNGAGLACYLMKNYKQAIYYYTKAIEIDPNYSYVYIFYNNRGKCYEALGDNEKAQADYAKGKNR